MQKIYFNDIGFIEAKITSFTTIIAGSSRLFSTKYLNMFRKTILKLQTKLINRLIRFYFIIQTVSDLNKNLARN